MKLSRRHVVAALLRCCMNDIGSFEFCSAFRPRVGSPSIRRAPFDCLCCLHKDAGFVNDGSQCDPNASIQDRNRRRAVQVAVLGAVGAAGSPQQVAYASPLDLGTTIAAPSSDLEPGLLDSRVTENLMSAPPYGMEGPDIYYPPWFAGTWKVASTTTDVQAPLGTALFGGNRTFESAQLEIGKSLQYESRFVMATGNTTIADREYNVRSIAQAAMGATSVLDVPVVSPNKLTCILAPIGSPSVLQATLLTTNRRQETISETRFDCSEVVQESVASAAGRPSTLVPRLAKQVETTSLYTYSPMRDAITCRQRSAAYLLPSQQDPVALKMWQASRGRPVDVRFYDVVYSARR